MSRYRIIFEFEASDDPSAREQVKEMDLCLEGELLLGDIKLQRIEEGKSPVGLKI